MSTRTSIKGHPIHSAMIVLPAGLFLFSFICDLFWLGTGRETWSTVAYYTLAGALVTGLIAAVPGYIDYKGLKTERARQIGRRHMSLNIVAMSLGLVSLWLRYVVGETWLWPIALSALAVLVLAVSGWAGATLVHVLGVSQPAATLAERSATATDRVREPADLRGAEAMRDMPVHDDHRTATATRRPVTPTASRPWQTGGMAAHPAMDEAVRDGSDRRDTLRPSLGGMHVQEASRQRDGQREGRPSAVRGEDRIRRNDERGSPR